MKVIYSITLLAAGLSLSQAVCTSSQDCAQVAHAAIRSLQPSRPLAAGQISAVGIAQRMIQPALNAATKGYFDGGGSDIDTEWCPNKSYVAKALQFALASRCGKIPSMFASRYLELLPVEVATLIPNKAVTYETQCFGAVAATAVTAGNSLNVTISGSSPKTLLCSDVLLIVSSYRVLGALIPGELKPTEHASFSLERLESKDLEQGGFKVLIMPCGIVGSVESLIKTASLFVGDDDAMYRRSMDFLRERHVWPSNNTFNRTVYLEPTRELLPSGTQLAIGRLDGLDPIIMWLTGGLTGHVAVCVWEGDQLYVVESTAPNPFGKVYWPCANGYCGIMRTPWKEWNTLGQGASYHVGVLPLADPYASAFDEDKFWQYFSTVEGTPYGYASMMNVFTDTNPNQNWPAPVTNSILTMIAYLFNDLTPTTNSTTPGGGVDAYDYLIRAFNKRTSAGCMDMNCVTDYTITHNTSYPAVAAQVELDTYRYFDNKNVSMVCSVFAASVYKNAIPRSVLPFFEAEEQTPKDNYQMAMFDGSHFTAENCPGGYFTSPSGSWCQIMGEWEMPLGDNGYNTIHPYENMNNYCPSQWTPDASTRYVRCPPGKPNCC